MAETTQDLRGAETKLANQNQTISKLEEDKVSLTRINQAYREFVEGLTEPGMAEKIIKKAVRSYPAESAISMAILGYLAKKYLRKWRNIPKVEQLKRQKKELEEAKERLLNDYHEKE